MTKYLYLILFLTAVACEQKELPTTVSSPDQVVTIDFALDENGAPTYMASYGDKAIAEKSALGFELGDGVSLKSGLKLINSSLSSFDETWEQPWGEERFIRNNYNQLKVELMGDNGLKLNVIFRAFDGGVAFQYEFPKQSGLDEFVVMNELTEFNMSADHKAWWIPAYEGNRYEYEYTATKMSEMDRVHTPLTLEMTNGLVLHLHEAALYDYSSMVIKSDGATGMKCDLVPNSTTDPVKAYLKAPFNTPWRTMQVGESPSDLITDYMILNLNEPNKLGDVSWVEPGKYIGVWWEMFINIGTWAQGPKHAANTANVKKYIDFASEHGFKGVLVEGWNYGWDGNWMGGGTKFEFAKPYPDFDVEELSRYGKEKDVYIIGHHETGADIDNYDEQLEDAYAFLSKYGMKAVKTGYVENGDTLPNGQYHHGQAFVQHFQRGIEMGAKYKTMIVAHEPIHDTGKRRTYPNMVSREGARGQEYNAFGGNSPAHVTVLPFTRMLSGPMDYTPGVFDIKMKTNPTNQVLGTMARELALYVAFYAPMMMANDLPENYQGHPAFQFIKDVPTDWERTVALDGAIGEHVSIARQERGTDNWFVGAITNEKARTTTVNFDFLTSGKTYSATIYRNSDDADYIDNPTGYVIEEVELTSDSTMDFALCRAGGVAISIFPQQ